MLHLLNKSIGKDVFIDGLRVVLFIREIIYATLRTSLVLWFIFISERGNKLFAVHLRGATLSMVSCMFYLHP